jgi:hypothetical protein
MPPLSVVGWPEDKTSYRELYRARGKAHAPSEGFSPMRAFIGACIAAAVIAVCAVVVLNRVQEPVDVAFTTSAVRII